MSAEKIIIEAEKIGFVPGMTPGKFIALCYKAVYGIKLPETLPQLMNIGIKVTKTNLKVGDLVFPTQNNVGIYLGNGTMVHVLNTSKLPKISFINNLYTARRVINN